MTGDHYASYRAVNACMARALLRFSEPDAIYWVHDYHFLTLGAELRQLEIDRPIGFFLHTPWAARATMLAMPHHRDLVQAMLAYDLIGFQTDEDRQNFEDYLKVELGLTVIDGGVVSDWGLTQIATFPIGIDVDDFAARAARAVNRPEVARLRDSLQGGKLVIGVDRLDYSKGIANRVRAFDRMLVTTPSLKRRCRCCRSPCRRAAASAPIAISSPSSPRWSAKSTAATARSIGCRSATSTAALRSRPSPASIARRMSAW